MKVKELIEHLQKLSDEDKELEVRVWDPAASYYSPDPPEVVTIRSWDRARDNFVDKKVVHIG